MNLSFEHLRSTFFTSTMKEEALQLQSEFLLVLHLRETCNVSVYKNFTPQPLVYHRPKLYYGLMNRQSDHDYKGLYERTETGRC